MKKQLNVDVVTNELRGNSAFFPRYKEEPATPPAPKPAPPVNTSASVAYPVPPVPVVPPVPLERGTPSVPKRVMKQRHPFDIYSDQYDALQELALEEGKQGGIGSMSAMVREALDRLIAEKMKARK